jgi:hypothetical protein
VDKFTRFCGIEVVLLSFPLSAVVTVERSTKLAGTDAVFESFPAKAVVTVERLTAEVGTDTMVATTEPGPEAVTFPVRAVI